jgi:hypothetical protein
MSDDIESLLRSGLAERADAAPTFDDPALADLAIAGAGRIRRRRRAAAAASGAGLLVLGAAVFVWQPWLVPDDEGENGVIAADTNATEVQDEFAMEFLVAEPDGAYSVLTEDGDTIPFGAEEPPGDIYKLANTYMSETATSVLTVDFDGEAVEIEKPSEAETYTTINGAGDRFAMVTPNSDFSTEDYSLVDVSLHGATEESEFSTSYAVTLEDWDDTTAVFTTDLNSATAGVAGDYYFNDDYQLGLESVSAAGFGTAVLVDTTDPEFVCVSDLDAAGEVGDQEQCGPVDSDGVAQSLSLADEGAPADVAADPTSLVERVIGNVQSMEDPDFAPLEDLDLGEYQQRYDSASEYWTDPMGEWQIAGNRDADSWLLIDASGDEPVVSELEPPANAVMPILSYT